MLHQNELQIYCATLRVKTGVSDRLQSLSLGGEERPQLENWLLDVSV